MRRLPGCMFNVARTLFPRGQDIEHGPPVARVQPFLFGVLSLLLLVAWGFGVPTASDAVMPLFIPPPFLLYSRKQSVCATGFVWMAFACWTRTLTLPFLPDIEVGQRITGGVVWAFLGAEAMLMARAVMARGVR